MVKRLIAALVLAVMLTIAIAGTALAVPGANSPWSVTGTNCTHNNGTSTDTTEMTHDNGRVKCFK